MRLAVLLLPWLGVQGVVRAQDPPLTLVQAIELARVASPGLAAARASARAAGEFARQAGAFPNPSLAFGREHTSGPDGGNGQVTVEVTQQLALTGVRRAELAAARARAAAASAEARRAERLLEAQVTRSFVRLVSGRRRAALADRLQVLTDSAAAIIVRRFAAGDASGVDRRRLQLEAARYTAAAIATRFEADSSATELAALIGADGAAADLTVVDSFPSALPVPPIDSLLRWLDQRNDLQAGEMLVSAAVAEGSARSREWIPTPTLSAGYKREEVAGRPGRPTGFIAGLSFPMPLWDRRGAGAAGQAALADRARAERDQLRRAAVAEVRGLAGGVVSLIEQRRTLGSRLGREADLALAATSTAFAEGELPLVQWLDAVRAFYEAEVMLVHLDAEVSVRWSALAAAAGVSPERLGGTAR